MKYKGIAYPIKKSAKGLLHNTNDIKQIKADLASLILTHPGERVMEPHFGIDFFSVELNRPKEMVSGDFRHLVAKSIKRWEKRIQVVDINVSLKTEIEGTVENIIASHLIVSMKIIFIDPVNLHEQHELYIEKSLGGVNGRYLPF